MTYLASVLPHTHPGNAVLSIRLILQGYMVKYRFPRCTRLMTTLERKLYQTNITLLKRYHLNNKCTNATSICADNLYLWPKSAPVHDPTHVLLV
jgi:hypothetical protein